MSEHEKKGHGGTSVATTEAGGKAVAESLSPERLARMQQSAGASAKQLGAEDYALPFLKILQGLSPELERSNSAFIPGASIGDLVNSVTRELYNGQTGVRIVRCNFSKKYIEWRPREVGGGLVNISGTLEEAQALKLRDNPNIGPAFDPKRDTEIIETAEIGCLIETAAGWLPIILAWTKTKLKVSRLWSTRWAGETFQKYGLPHENPSLAVDMPELMWRLTTKSEKNAKGVFYQPDIACLGLAPEPVVQRALEFAEVLKAGRARGDYNKMKEEFTPPETPDDHVEGIDQVV